MIGIKVFILNIGVFFLNLLGVLKVFDCECNWDSDRANRRGYLYLSPGSISFITSISHSPQHSHSPQAQEPPAWQIPGCLSCILYETTWAIISNRSRAKRNHAWETAKTLHLVPEECLFSPGPNKTPQAVSFHAYTYSGVQIDCHFV